MIAQASFDFTKFWEGKRSESRSPWIEDLRYEALKELERAVYPGTHLEEWRKVPLKGLDLGEIFSKKEEFLSIKVHTDNNLVVFKNWNDLEPNQIDYVRSIYKVYLEKYHNQFFSILPLLTFEKAFFIDIPDNTEIQDPIVLEISYKDYATHASPVLFIRIGKNSHVKITERITSPLSEDIHFFNSLSMIEMGAGSGLDFISWEDLNSQAFHVRTQNFNLSSDSELRHNYFNLGGYRGKTFLDVDLNGTGANAILLGAACPSKRELQDLEYRVNHNSGHTSSDLNFRTVLRGKSHHIFTGNIQIPVTSKQVNAHQLNHNLVLEKSARAEANPRLEVFSDSVKCSHGATMSEVNEEQMFYLLSRGIEESEARKLIVEGFLSEIIEKVDRDEFGDEIKSRLIQKIID